MNVYSVNRAAKYFGKSNLTLRKWIDQGIIPTPILIDSSRGFKYYTKDELDIIAKVIEKHTKTYSYILSSHTDVVHEIHNGIEAFRHKNF